MLTAFAAQPPHPVLRLGKRFGNGPFEARKRPDVSLKALFAHNFNAFY
jgi:hypothetical protein